ncbi:MAG TPA: glycosyltransferase [Pyrinomonadaceae bacterium]|nr:glycosyltransferase [Pyrinomonadaceae bacterium]
MLRTLYICYFGIREPLVQTQVLPYLRQLATANVKVHLLTFEPRLREQWTSSELEARQKELAAEGIAWSSLPYHKSPSLPATLYDILAGARFAVRLARREGIAVIHARAHVPMAMALLARRFARVKLIFDIRGLMAEEYADAGIWAKNSLPYRLVKKLENAGIRHADQIVVLTERLRHWLVEHKLKPAGQIQVIPCCVDLSRYTAPVPEARQVRFEIVYAGSVTGVYLLEEMARFFLAVRERQADAFFRILTTGSAEEVTARLQHAGVRSSDFWVGKVKPDDVPGYLQRARLGLSFRQPEFTQIAASPTKIAEYLAAGLPVVCNSGVGDVDALLAREHVGVLLEELDARAYARAAEQALQLVSEPQIRERCIAVARRNFDLTTVGAARYQDVYGRIAIGPNAN